MAGFFFGFNSRKFNLLIRVSSRFTQKKFMGLLFTKLKASLALNGFASNEVTKAISAKPMEIEIEFFG